MMMAGLSCHTVSMTRTMKWVVSTMSSSTASPVRGSPRHPCEGEAWVQASRGGMKSRSCPGRQDVQGGQDLPGKCCQEVDDTWAKLGHSR